MNGVSNPTNSINNTPPDPRSPGYITGDATTGPFDPDDQGLISSGGSSSGGSGSSSDEDDDDSYSGINNGSRRRHPRRQQGRGGAGGGGDISPGGGDEEDEANKASLKNIWKHITIEPMMFAHMFGMTTTSVVLQNLYINRICIVSLGYNQTVCDNLADDQYRHQETEIDELASKFVTYRSLIEAGFPIIFSLFLGPWTDIHGTKWPMLLPMFGYFLSALSYLILCHFPHVPPEVLLISSIPVSVVGGLVAIIMSAFSFIAKATSPENRSFRVAMVEASWFLGGPLGTLTGGLVYKYGGFPAVFSTSGSLFLTAFIYGFIVIREELPVIEDRENRNCCTDMFNVQAVKDMFGTVFLRRSGLQRRWLLLMLFAISLRILALFGYLQNMYLYTKHKFKWDVKEYTEYSVSDSFIAISGGFVMIMTFMKIFKVNDALIGIISTVGPFFAQFVFAFSIPGKGWMMYLGSSFQLFAGLISIVLRAMISKVVAKDEIARVYTFLACSEATMPIIGVPLYSYIFRHSLETFPGAMFMVSAGLYAVIIFCFIYLYFSMRNSNNHVQMEDPRESSA